MQIKYNITYSKELNFFTQIKNIIKTMRKLLYTCRLPALKPHFAVTQWTYRWQAQISLSATACA